MRASNYKEEVKIYFDPPKDLCLSLYGIDDIEYNHNLYELSTPPYDHESYNNRHYIGFANFSMGHKGKYKLYSDMYFDKEGEPQYTQDGWWGLCNPLEVKM